MICFGVNITRDRAVIINLDSQLDMLSNSSGNKPLGTSMREFLDWINYGGKTHLKCGDIIP